MGRPRAHPRSRGENEPPTNAPASSLGSSPLTRGKHKRWWFIAIIARLIPAHAGKTITGRVKTSPFWAHPRSRGENIPHSCPDQKDRGSSPLTRGKQHLRPHRGPCDGLIPAHAGKTVCFHKVYSVNTAHPRSRGENELLGEVVERHSGSSPLTRGKLRRRQVRARLNGLIPAHAGKTSPHTQLRTPSRGSSPLTRGKRLLPDRCDAA